MDDPNLLKASGVVTLPFHVRWSEPSLTYDLRRRADRLRVYEQVLREGTADDVRIDIDQLLYLFDDLVSAACQCPSGVGGMVPSPPGSRACVLSPLQQRIATIVAGLPEGLAVFGRAEARDFMDLMAVEDQFGLDRLLQGAAQKDHGFNLTVFSK